MILRVGGKLPVLRVAWVSNNFIKILFHKKILRPFELQPRTKLYNHIINIILQYISSSFPDWHFTMERTEHSKYVSLKNISSILTEHCQNHYPEYFEEESPKSEFEHLVARKVFNYILEVLDDYVAVEDEELGDVTGRL